MRRRPLQRGTGATIAGLWALSGAGVRAQAPPPDEGPLIIGERRDSLRFFQLDRFEAALDLTGRYSRSERSVPGVATLRESDRIFQESLDLGFRSFFGHRNLLDLSGDVRFGLEQRRSDSDTPGLSQDTDQTLWLYDVSGLILGAGPMPTTLYSRQDQSFYNREFAGTIENINQEHGVIFEVRSDFAPTTIQAFHRQQDQNDPFGLSDYALTQDSVNGQSDVRLADNQTLRLEYTFDSIDETQGAFGGQRYDQQDASATHEIRFGTDRQNSLNSSAHFYEQTGDAEQQSLSLDEQLYLQHTERLSSRYRLLVQDQEFADSRQRLYRGSALVRHKLFESLSSTFGVGASRTDLPDDGFTGDEMFARATFDYTKRVPYGRLDLGLDAGFDRQQNSERGAEIAFLNDPRTFNDPLPITINRRNIVVGSVVVTNSTGLRTYLEGPDYRADYFPDRVELRRVVGGAIADGETVLVDYDVGPEPASTIDSTGLGLSFRYGIGEGVLSGLSAYASYHQVDYSLDAVDPSRFVLDESRRTRLGLEYTRSGLTLIGEREIFDSEVAPYDLWRLEARYTRRLGVGSVLNLTGSYEQINYDSPDNQLELSVLTGEWVQRITPELDFRIWANFRDENDQIAEDTRGYEQALEVRWHRRQTEVVATITNSMNEGQNEDNNYQTFTLGVRRSF